MAVVCNPIRMGRCSELMVVCVCHLDEVLSDPVVLGCSSGCLDFSILPRAWTLEWPPL